jgi:tetratricopeptide (TPR) repeat protein
VLDPRSVDAREDLVTYYLQAPGVMGGSKEKARSQAAELAKLDVVRGHIAMGRILAGDKDLAAAEAEFSRALAADPAGFRGAVALGSFYVGQKRWADARALWQRRLDSDAGDTMARYQLGRVASDSGTDLEKGVEHLKAYLAVPAEPGRPTWADAHWRLGLLHEKLVRADDARAEMREALKLVPGHAQARKDLERLQK